VFFLLIKVLIDLTVSTITTLFLNVIFTTNKNLIADYYTSKLL